MAVFAGRGNTRVRSPYQNPPRANSALRPASTIREVTSPSGQSYRDGRPSGGGNTSPRISSNSSGQISQVQPAAVAPPPMPTIPTENDFLGGDTAYLSQQAALKKALEDYVAQMNEQKSQYGVDHAARVKQLGLSREQGVEDSENDFASRGLLKSGLFVNALGELNEGFDRQGADMERAKSNWMTDLEQQLGNFKSEQGLTAERARADALARRAMQYGLGV